MAATSPISLPITLPSQAKSCDVDPLTRELVELRGAGPTSRIRGGLAEGLRRISVQAALDLALDFHAWRHLRTTGLDAAEAAELMAGAVPRV